MTVVNLCRMTAVQPALLFGVKGFGRRDADTGEIAVYMALAVVVIALVCLAIFIGNKLAHRRRYNSHASLFAGLCRVHGLDRAACKLLRQVVSCRGLAQPARVFTEPQWLDPSDTPQALRGQTGQLAQLHQRLFLGPDS